MPCCSLNSGENWRGCNVEVHEQMPENPACNGFKVYSQADEDGIIEDIARRIGVDDGHFIEIGCGDGRENNTHYLLLKGWRGIWVDGNPGNHFGHPCRASARREDCVPSR